MFSVVVPVNADYNAEAVLKAADRLVANQNLDGGFSWVMGSSISSDNLLGITAMGILKAHDIDDKLAYEMALAKAYKYAKDTVPGWTVVDGKWKETTRGVESFPDVTFLILLAKAASVDSTLLTTIQSVEPQTSVSDIADLGKTRWHLRLNHLGATPPNTIGTATAMVEYIRDARYPTWSGLIPWDLEAAVKAALALESYYPGQGYINQANDIAEVIYDSLYGTSQYFNYNDPTETCYVLGLAGAIEAFTEAGLYPDDARDLKDLLIGYQSVNGYWDEDESGSGGQESVQSTAYAVMALLAQGDDDAMVSALEGNTWLVDTQDGHGGWDPCYLGGTENLEVNSEAAWALYECMPVAKLPRNIDPLYQPHGYQRMELVLTITGKTGPTDVTIEGPFYYRGIDDGDASWHAVLIVKSSDYDRAEPGDELLCHWKYLDEISAYGWIINAKGFNMHLYPTGPRVGDTAQDGERWRYEQPVEGKSYGASVTGFLYQIGV